LAKEGLSKLGHHGPMTSVGVPRHKLPHWDDIQLMVAQMSDKPLKLDIPLFVSDMSFGARQEETKVTLAKGAEPGVKL